MLETLVSLSWRWYLALLLMVVGAICAVWGAKRGWKGLLGATRGNSAQLVPFMQGFRAFAIGLALVGLGAAWAWHLPWLLVLSLAMGGGETLETSLILFALRHGAHLEIGRRRTGNRRGAVTAASPLVGGPSPDWRQRTHREAPEMPGALA
jgi:hypothetical protein